MEQYNILENARSILEEAIDEHSPALILLMFSGGHDSVTSTHVAANTIDFDAVVHLNTGIGIPETREYVRKICSKFDWTLEELHPPDLNYEEMVKKFGFPTPVGHSYPYSYLKEKSIRKYIRENKDSDEIAMLISGIRWQESRARRGRPPIQKKGRTVWCSPIIDWSKTECGQYMEREGIPRNEVVDLMHMSGECLCGAFAGNEEFRLLETWYPDVAERIKSIEKDVRGVREDRIAWGGRNIEDQLSHSLDEFFGSDDGELCQDCHLTWGDDGAE